MVHQKLYNSHRSSSPGCNNNSTSELSKPSKHICQRIEPKCITEIIQLCSNFFQIYKLYLTKCT
ncbi:hypothetical protein C0J52_27599 [Blattella germanica]|nr:hypothetical protein C0J52_27599 [Blattella germanica]